MEVVQKDGTGGWIDSFSAKWLPGTGFIDLESGAIYTDQGSGRPDGSAADGAWLAQGWAYNNGLNDVDESPVAWIPTPTVSKSVGSTATEGGASATATFTRTGSTLFPLSVKFTLSSSTDLIPVGLTEVSGAYTVEIPRGQASANVTLQAFDDNLVEANETADLTIIDGMDDSSVGSERNAGLQAYDHDDTVSTVTVVSEDVTNNATTTITRTGGSGVVKIGQTATVQVVFSLAVTGFTDGELTATSGTLGSLSGSGTTYSAVWTPTNGVDASTVTFGVAADVAQTGTGSNLLATGLAVNFDTLAPSAPTITSPANLDLVGANLTVSGALPSGATLVSVTVGGTTQTATITSGWSSSFTGVAGGSTTISVTATDAAGNVSGASAITVTVDASPPVLTVGTLTTPTAASNIAFSGTVDEQVDLTIRDGSTVLGTGSSPAGAFGPLSFGAVGDGSHSFTITAVDVLGNSTTSAAQVVLVDATGPTVTLGTPSDTVVKAGDTVTITATYADVGTGVSAITLVDGNIGFNLVDTATATAAVTGSGLTSRTITLSGFAGNGSMTVQVMSGTASDALGNLGPESLPSATITVDNIAPTVAFTTASSTTSDATPTLTGTAETGATVRLMEGATELGSFVAASGAWSITSTTLGEGVHTLTATATDAAGNLGTAASTIDLTIDLTAPAVAITTVAGATNDTTPAVTGTGENGATVELLEGATVLGTTTISAGTWTISLSTALAEGSHTVTARATDAVGNAAVTAGIALLIDTVAPTVVIAAPSVVLANVDDSVTLTVTYADAASGLAGTTLVNGNVTVNTTGTAAASAAVTGTGPVYTVTLTGLTGDGTVSISLAAGTATDLAGNAAAAAGPSATITVDNTGPVVAITTPTTITADPTPVISGTSDDNGATIELRDGTTVLGSGTVSSGTWSIAPATALAAGTYSLTARGTDLAGNSGANSSAVSITINLSGPTVTISAGTVSGTTATFTATFSSAVAGLVPGDIIVGGTAGGTKTVTISANAANTIYTITVSGLATPSGTVTVEIPADVATAVAGGDPTQGSSTASVTFTVPTGGTSGSSGGSSGGGGCGAGGLIGLIAIGALAGLRLRRRR